MYLPTVEFPFNLFSQRVGSFLLKPGQSIAGVKSFHSTCFPSEWEEFAQDALPRLGFSVRLSAHAEVPRIDASPKSIPYPAKNRRQHIPQILIL